MQTATAESLEVNADNCSALFVAIGSGVTSGPLCLLLGFVFWATVVLSIAECRTYTPLQPMIGVGACD